MEIHSVLTKDSIPIELVHSSKVNGPDQNGGLSFGTTYLYYKIPGSNWTKIEYSKSWIKTKQLIENSTLLELERALSQ